MTLIAFLPWHRGFFSIEICINILDRTMLNLFLARVFEKFHENFFLIRYFVRIAKNSAKIRRNAEYGISRNFADWYYVIHGIRDFRGFKVFLLDHSLCLSFSNPPSILPSIPPSISRFMPPSIPPSISLAIPYLSFRIYIPPSIPPSVPLSIPSGDHPTTQNEQTMIRKIILKDFARF